jgi:hypothetical protein
VVGQWYLHPRPFCSPPLALGGWAMILDCWFLSESPWKKAQLHRRAVSVSESEPQHPPGNPPSRDLGAGQGAILGRRARPTSDGGAFGAVRAASSINHEMKVRDSITFLQIILVWQTGSSTCSTHQTARLTCCLLFESLVPRFASVMDPPRGSPRLQAPLVSLGPGEALPDPIIDLCAMNELSDLVPYVVCTDSTVQ